MRKRPLTTGEKGWIGLLLYVLTVDSLAWARQARGKRDETMSVAFGRSLQRPRYRRLTVMAWMGTTAHLFWSFPLPGSQLLKRVVQRCSTR